MSSTGREDDTTATPEAAPPSPPDHPLRMGRDDVSIPLPVPASRCFLYLLIAISSIGGALFGYDTGVVSGAMIQIKSDADKWPRVGGFDLSSIKQESVVSVTTVTAAIGSLVCTYLNDWLGRKPVNLISSIIFVLACVVMGVAPNFEILLVGRALVGIAVGFAATTVPMYIAEVAPSDERGKLVTVNNVSIVVGQVLASLVDCGFAVGKTHEGWRYMLALGGVPALVMFIGFLFLPESPRWLLQKRKEDEAVACLKRIRGTDDVADEVASLIADMEQDSRSLPFSEIFLSAKNRPIVRALTLGCGLQLLQQIVGINTLMYYSATILQSSTASDGDDPLSSKNTSATCLSAATAAAQMVGCIIGMFLVDRYGRRTMTLSSLGLVTVTLVVLGFSFFNRSSQVMASIAMCSYLLAFGVGMSPMPWLINAEIYPMEARAKCVGISTFVNWCATFLISFTFLDLSKAISTDRENPKDHPDGAFWLYAVFGAIGFALLYKYLPETKGLPLEDIIALFGAEEPAAERVAVQEEDIEEGPRKETTPFLERNAGNDDQLEVQGS